MKLYLIRHAKAKYPKEMLDIDRSLSEQGRVQAEKLANFLSNKTLPTDVWCSASQRTIETLTYIEKKHSFLLKKKMNELYLCTKDYFLKELWSGNQKDDLLIVGHNFGISDLVNYFTGELLLMDTAEYICIDFGELNLNESSKGTGTIVDRFIP